MKIRGMSTCSNILSKNGSTAAMNSGLLFTQPLSLCLLHIHVDALGVS